MQRVGAQNPQSSNLDKRLSELLQKETEACMKRMLYTRSAPITITNLNHLFHMQQFNDAMENMVATMKRELATRQTRVLSIPDNDLFTLCSVLNREYGFQHEPLFREEDAQKMISGISGRIQEMGKLIAAINNPETRNHHSRQLGAAVMEEQVHINRIYHASPISFAFRALNQVLESKDQLADTDKASMLWSFVSDHIRSLNLNEVRDLADAFSSYYRPDRDQPQQDYAARLIEQVVRQKISLNNGSRDEKLLSNLLSDKLMTSRKPTRYNQILDNAIAARRSLISVNMPHFIDPPVVYDDDLTRANKASAAAEKALRTFEIQQWNLEEEEILEAELHVQEVESYEEEEKQRLEATNSTSQIQLSLREAQVHSLSEEDAEAITKAMGGDDEESLEDQIQVVDSYDPSNQIHEIDFDEDDPNLSQSSVLSSAPRLGIQASGDGE